MRQVTEDHAEAVSLLLQQRLQPQVGKSKLRELKKRSDDKFRVLVLQSKLRLELDHPLLRGSGSSRSSDTKAPSLETA